MQFTVGNAFSEGWRVMKPRYGALLGAAWIYILISAAMGFVPILGSLAQIVVLGPLLAGWSYMGVKAYRGNVEVGDLFAGFKKFGPTLGLYWMTVLIVFAIMIPGGIAAGVAFAVDQEFEGPGIAIAVVGGVAVLVALLLIMSRLAFATLIIMDTDAGVMESLRRSWALTRSHVGTVIGLYLCMGLIGIGLAILLYLPLIFIGMPWFVCAGAAAFDMMGGGEDPEAIARVYE